MLSGRSFETQTASAPQDEGGGSKNCGVQYTADHGGAGVIPGRTRKRRGKESTALSVRVDPLPGPADRRG